MIGTGTFLILWAAVNFANAAGFVKASVTDLRVWVYEDPTANWYSEPIDPPRDSSQIVLDGQGRYYLVGSSAQGFSLSTVAYPTDLFPESEPYLYGRGVVQKQFPEFFLPNGYNAAFSGRFEGSGILSGTKFDKQTYAGVAFDDGPGDGSLGGGTGGFVAGAID